MHTIVAADGVLEPLAEAGQTLHITAVVQVVAGQVVQIHLAPGIPGGLGGLDGSLLGGLLDTEIRWGSGVKGVWAESRFVDALKGLMGLPGSLLDPERSLELGGGVKGGWVWGSLESLEA